MDLLLVSDFVALSLLVFVLFRVRGRQQDEVMHLWTAGLLLILLQAAASIAYGMKLPTLAHGVAHALSLNAYGIAGAFFLLSASQGLRRLPRGRAFLWANTVPHLLLFTVYGLDVCRPALYWPIAGLGVAVGLASPFLLRRSSPLFAAFALIWTPLVLCLQRHDCRAAVFTSLFFLYGLSAIFFARSLPRGSQGKVAVVAGFSLWALCFLTHPWMRSGYPVWTDFADHLWDMPKFIITIGLLLVLLENQVRSNEWLALHDGLTGLPNRRLFEDRLQHALVHAQRSRSQLALFMLDLDGFKQINDTLGHDAGDCLLKGLSANLLQSLRRSDTLARLGGDEFCLIAADLDGAPGNRLPAAAPVSGHACAASRLPQVQRILAAMVQGVEMPVPLGPAHGHAIATVSASIGVAVYPDEAATVEELIRRADQRMYASKRTRSHNGKHQQGEPVSGLDLQRV